MTEERTAQGKFLPMVCLVTVCLKWFSLSPEWPHYLKEDILPFQWHHRVHLFELKSVVPRSLDHHMKFDRF